MSKDDIKKTAPYEGGTQQADAVQEDGRAAGYFGETPYEASEQYEPRSPRETRGETKEYGERYRGKEYGTEAAEDFFAGAMLSGSDPLGSYTGTGLPKFGNRPVYFPPHDDELLPVQDADDL